MSSAIKIILFMVFGFLIVAGSCGKDPTSSLPASADIPQGCEFVTEGYGPAGTTALKVETWVSGLEVPWEIAFLPGPGLNALVPERPGRVRLIRGGVLQTTPVLSLPLPPAGEGGLLGLAIHPQFSTNRFFYVYYTTTRNGSSINRIERYKLSQDSASAASDRVILDEIGANTFHDGGRLRFGPDGMLYAGTGDAGSRELSQNPASLSGKILRISPDGGIPKDNPTSGNYLFALGLRNPESFDWKDAKTMLIADHGPSGEMGTGQDEISFARAGFNLGWPRITGCQAQAGLQSPVLSWRGSAPPGGALVPKKSLIPAFDGNLLVAMLGVGTSGAQQLHRLVFDSKTNKMTSHEVYFKGVYGRLRALVQGPDGAIYLGTSNCDGRNTCPAQKDVILRITGS